MAYNPVIHHRRSIRLKGFDYTQSAIYFVTICCYRRECLFGAIAQDEMILNEFGNIVAEEWLRSFEIRDELQLDAWVVMPNHFHGLLCCDRPIVQMQSLSDNDRPVDDSVLGKNQLKRPARSLGSIIAGFKAVTTKQINQHRNAPGSPVWQRNYYESIVRDDRMLNHIRDYIDNNPRSWQVDSLHPNNIPKIRLQ
ncbi:MAG: transposase [Oscillatoriales cyanobacterium]|nr:MAG: transposase [Oscillatoriales cyanobacterium]